MKKELIWAIIIGFGIGLIITYGVLSAKKALKPKIAQTEMEPAATPTPSSVFLKIENPQDGSIIDKEKTLLQGKTNSKAILAIFTEKGELIIEADEEGKFQTDISLAEGANEITIVAFDEKGNEASQSMTLVYSTAKL